MPKKNTEKLELGLRPRDRVRWSVRRKRLVREKV